MFGSRRGPLHPELAILIWLGSVDAHSSDEMAVGGNEEGRRKKKEEEGRRTLSTQQVRKPISPLHTTSSGMKWHEVACSRCDTPLEVAYPLGTRRLHSQHEVARHSKWHTPLEVAYATRSGTPLEVA